MVAGLLAILKAGGAYLPLDAALPPARLALLLDDARPAILLTERPLLARLPESTARIVMCDEPFDDEEGAPDDVHCVVDAESLAYVLYTSGSTGKSKAVEVTHRSLVNLLAAMQREPGFDADDRLLAVTTLSFDIAAAELFLPLVSGGRLIIATRDDAADPSRLAALIRRSGCTVMQATPATWRGLIEAGWTGEVDLKILCGGEALSRSLAARLLGCGASLWNMYGPTETTIWSLLHKVGQEDGAPPIGRPLANTRAYVLNGRGNPVPTGVPGELCIGGAGVARGYRKDEALTREKFVALPVLPGERLYRTGDIARYRSDGAIEYLGRIDNQVKIRGFRVGLEEIEDVIASHPDIASAAVAAWPDASGEMSLVAYIVGKDAPAPCLAELRQFLRWSLPDYMLPSRSIALPAMPMTSNRKVDRKRLPEPQQCASPPETSEPRDELERKLAAIWKKLLGASTVDINDSFFDLGGHSLLAFMLIIEIKRMMGRELPLAALFRAPTIAALAELLRSTETPPFSYLVPLRPQGTGRPLFIVHGIFGNVLQLRGLAKRIRGDRPIYALQARGVDPQQEPHATIAEMAEAYIAAIRALQPAGPYALAGYSFGGLVAYEMACRLRENGEAVDLLALFEVDVHERNLPLAAWFAYQWRLAKRVVRKVTTLPRRQCLGYLAEKCVMVWDRVLLRFDLRSSSTMSVPRSREMAAMPGRPSKSSARSAVLAGWRRPISTASPSRRARKGSSRRRFTPLAASTASSTMPGSCATVSSTR
jgi:amino acid adenylation domain-containing protein